MPRLANPPFHLADTAYVTVLTTNTPTARPFEPQRLPPPIERCPLSGEHFRQIAEANCRAHKALRPAKLAALNGWVTAVSAGGCVLMAWADPMLLLWAAGLAWIAWGEFAGRRKVRRFDPEGATRLAWNQLALMGIVVTYAAWGLHGALTGPNPYAGQAAAVPEAAATLNSIGRLYLVLRASVYGALIGGSLLMQGLAAWYCWACAKRIRSHVTITAPWILDLQRHLAL